MSDVEFREWQEYYSLEPLGEHRIDLAAAIVASTAVNLMRDKKSKPAEIGDFMPKFKPPGEREKKYGGLSPNVAAMRFVAAHGGRFVRVPRPKPPA